MIVIYGIKVLSRVSFIFDLYKAVQVIYIVQHKTFSTNERHCWVTNTRAVDSIESAANYQLLDIRTANTLGPQTTNC